MIKDELKNAIRVVREMMKGKGIPKEYTLLLARVYLQGKKDGIDAVESILKAK